MLIYRNAEGVHGQRKVGNPALGNANFFDDSLRLVIRCLPALGVLIFFDVTEAFFIPADRMPELLAYFKDTYIRSRRWPGHSNVIVLPTFQKKDGIISKPRLKD